MTQPKVKVRQLRLPWVVHARTKPDTLLAITHDVLPTLKASFGVLKDNITGRDPTSSSIALDVVYLIISYPGVVGSVPSEVFCRLWNIPLFRVRGAVGGNSLIEAWINAHGRVCQTLFWLNEVAEP